MTRITFTPLALKNLKCPPRNAKGAPTQVDYWDATQPGFGLRVSSTGVKTWVLFTRVFCRGEWRQTRLQLGKMKQGPDDAMGVSLADARTLAAGYMKIIDQGQDPREVQRKTLRADIARQQTVFDVLTDRYLDAHCSRLRARTQEQYRQILKGKDVAAWKNKPVETITRRDIIALLDQIELRGALTHANRTLAVVRAFMHWCIQRDLIEHAPTAHIKPRGPENKRTRHLFGDPFRNRPSEIGLFWEASHQDQTFGPIFRMLLVTGQREREVSNMKWQELIDLDGPQPRWLIPAERAKNGKEHLVPLSSMAVEELKEAELIRRCEFVFTANGSDPVNSFSKAKNRMDRNIRQVVSGEPEKYHGQFVEPWVIHDLRRTFKTGLAELGVRKEVRDALTNHKPQGIDAHYIHASYEGEKREAVTKWDAQIKKVLRCDAEIDPRATARQSVVSLSEANT